MGAARGGSRSGSTGEGGAPTLCKNGKLQHLRVTFHRWANFVIGPSEGGRIPGPGPVSVACCGETKAT